MIVLRKTHSPALAALAGSAILAIAGASSAAAQGPPATPPAAPAAPAGPVSSPPVTLSRPTTPEKAVAMDGFIQRWLILEPIKSGGLTQNVVQAAVKKEMFPNQFTGVPKDGDKVNIDPQLVAPPLKRDQPAGEPVLTWHAVDTRNYNVNLYHYSIGLGKQTSDVMFWVVTVINAPQEMKNVRLAIGSNAASVWWLNDEEVVGIYGDRQAVVDDGVSKRITLKKGANILRAVIVNGGGATDFCARFLDANDKPVKGITASINAPK
ncbi:MAG: acetylxylan esterase [Candidatus Solibacter sp.]